MLSGHSALFFGGRGCLALLGARVCSSLPPTSVNRGALGPAGVGGSGWGCLPLGTLTCSAVCFSSTSLACRCEAPRPVGGWLHWAVLGAGATMAEKVEEEVRGCGIGGTAEQPQLDPWGPFPTVGGSNRANLLGTATDSQKPLKMLMGSNLASSILGIYS